MTPLLILTHGEFGAVLLKAAEGMYGPQTQALALGLGPDETRESFAERVNQARTTLDGQALVLVDLICGTPWNVALLTGCAREGEVLAGVNLPMLLECIGLRDALPPRELAAELVRQLPQCFARGSVLLAGNQGGCA
jgi:mannose/fructose-specific phosphotransferase system component IIA